MENVIMKEVLTKQINYKLNFFLLLFGRLICGLGSAIFSFALGLYILDKTKSASAFSMILIFSALPGFFINIFGGVFIDRNSKKTIMVASDILSGVVVLIFMVLFSFYSSSLVILVANTIVLSTLQGFFILAANASIPNIVSDENVARANSASQIIWSATSVVGPIVGAVVYKFVGLQIIFSIFALALIIAGCAEALLKFNIQPKTTDDTKKTSYFEEMKEAMQYIFGQKILVLFFVFSAIVNFFFSPLISLVVTYINYNVIHVSGLQLSVIQAFGAIGLILGAVIISTRKSTDNLLKRFFILFQLQAIIIIFWTFPKLPLFAGMDKWIIAVMFGFLMGTICLINMLQNIPMLTYFQIKIPENLRARVLGVFGTATITSTLGMWVFGAVLDRVYWVYILVTAGVVAFLLGMVFGKNIHFSRFLKELNQKGEISINSSTKLD